MRKYLLVVFGAFALIGAIRAPSSFDKSTRNDTGTVIEGGEVGVLAVADRDCFDRPSGGNDGFGSVEVVPCEEPHDNQVYGKFDLAQGVEPNSDAAVAAIYDGCISRFEVAIGRPFDGLLLDIMPLVPTDEGWDVDRGVVCTIFRGDGTKLTYDAVVS